MFNLFGFKLSPTKLSSILLLFAVCSSPILVSAEKYQRSAQLDLPSCNVHISADEYYINDRGTTFSGNVSVLIGFANLKLNKVTLIKKKDGKCALIQEFDN